MTDIRTILRVEFVTTSKKDGAQRRITAWVDRLPDGHPDDVHRGIETFRLSIQDDDKLYTDNCILSSFNYLKAFLSDQLRGILKVVNYNTYSVEIIEDTHQLIQFQEFRCPSCNKKYLEHYGDLGAVIKWCNRCKEFITLT